MMNGPTIRLKQTITTVEAILSSSFSPLPCLSLMQSSRVVFIFLFFLKEMCVYFPNWYIA